MVQEKLLDNSYFSFNFVIIIVITCECMNLGGLMGKEEIKVHDNKATIPYKYSELMTCPG